MKCPDCKGYKATLTSTKGWVRCARCSATGEVVDVERVALESLLVSAEKYLAAVDLSGPMISFVPGVNKKVKAARDELRQVVANVRLMKEG